jgi:hypothetical protein
LWFFIGATRLRGKELFQISVSGSFSSATSPEFYEILYLFTHFYSYRVDVIYFNNFLTLTLKRLT